MSRARYDENAIKFAIDRICDHYCGPCRTPGPRRVYTCPECGDPEFSVAMKTDVPIAGCFRASCTVPSATTAPVLIAHFEGLDRTDRSWYPKALARGYEILGLPEPEDGTDSVSAAFHQVPVPATAGGAARSTAPPTLREDQQPRPAVTSTAAESAWILPSVEPTSPTPPTPQGPVAQRGARTDTPGQDGPREYPRRHRARRPRARTQSL